METITFKAPPGTRERLKKLGGISTLMRRQAEKLINGENAGVASAHDKAKQFIINGGSGVKKLSTTKDYLKPYAPQRNR